MSSSYWSLVSAASLLAALPSALAGFHVGSQKNIAVYWGQNSLGEGNGPNVQRNLAYYCENAEIGIIPIAFMTGISPPITNFANAGSKCDRFPGNPNLLRCPEIEQDIETCQTKFKKTIVLSLGGVTYSQGGWSSTWDAEKAAQSVWDMFGPVRSGSNVDRPFGSAVVDGFDFDFESTTHNLPAFGAKLRSLMDGASGKRFYLTASPQCVFPDADVGSTLDAVAFDFAMIQFYNNWCGVSNFQPASATQNTFNFDAWDKWAKSSKNPNVKIFLGVLANRDAGDGYINGEKLKAAIAHSKKFSSFGGVMMWDISQLYANKGFLSEVVNGLT